MRVWELKVVGNVSWIGSNFVDGDSLFVELVVSDLIEHITIHLMASFFVIVFVFEVIWNWRERI